MRWRIAAFSAALLAFGPFADAQTEAVVIELRSVIPGERVRLELVDGSQVEGTVSRLGPTWLEVRKDDGGRVRVSEEDFLRCWRLGEGVPELRCCIATPGWSYDPRRPVLWLDGGGGPGGTLGGRGVLGGVAVTCGIGDRRIVRVGWVHFSADQEERIFPARDAFFDSISVLYGIHARKGFLVTWAAAGPGYSFGEARGKVVFESGDRRWYRPHRYDAVGAVGDAYVGFAGRALGIGVGASVDVNPMRQTWGLQARLFYGALPKYPRKEAMP